MKKILFLLFSIILCSCSSNDELPGTDDKTKKAYVTKITSISSRSTTDLNFIYDSNNKLIKTETDIYFREFVYEGDKVKQIKSITKPNTPYYTVNFMYDAEGEITEVKRDNHHNGTIYYTKYEYFQTGEVSKVNIFDSLDSYNNNKYDRYYDLSGYTSNNNNFNAKDLHEFSISLNSYDIKLSETWNYDNKERPFFGEAIRNIQLPYATDGTELDWDITYATNNPVKLTVFDFRFGTNSLRKTFEYEYNSDSYPTKMIKKTYSSDGMLQSTFEQQFTYTLR